MLNINFNSMQNPYASNCGCSRMNPMNTVSPMNNMSSQMMMGMMLMSLMNMMTMIMGMISGGFGMPGGPAAFGAGGGSGSPISDFLGGGSSGSRGGGGHASGSHGGGEAGHGFPSGPSTGGQVDPSTVKDKSSTHGINASAQRGLEEAHKFGLPLVSGKRSGGGKSDHDHGNAIDVGTLPIGAASSTGGTPQMKQYAEHMRQQGKAGKLNVKYIIADGMIASSRDNWAWRPYTYPGKSQAELNRLKQTNRGEYNRLQHYDHVHVSFN